MRDVNAVHGNCGKIKFSSDGLSLVLTTLDGEGTYSYSCPRCAKVVIARSSANMSAYLVSAGVPVFYCIEPVVPSKRFEGPELSFDDLLDFHNQLENGLTVSAISEDAP